MQLQPRPTHLGMSLVWVAVVRRRGFHHGSRVMGDERQDIDQQKVCKQKCKCKFNMKELYNWISKSYLMSSYFLQIKKVTFFVFFRLDPFGTFPKKKVTWHTLVPKKVVPPPNCPQPTTYGGWLISPSNDRGVGETATTTWNLSSFGVLSILTTSTDESSHVAESKFLFPWLNGKQRLAV